MKTILIPVSQDCPFDNLKKAIECLAKKTDYKLHLVHILTNISAKEYAAALEKKDHEVLNAVKEESKVVHDFEKKLMDDGYEVESTISVGLFYEKFASIVNHLDPDFVLMITSGSDNIIEEIFGTNALYILENTKTPIFIIPDEFEFKKIQRAAVGLDLDDDQLSILEDLFSYTDKAGINPVFVKIDNSMQIDIIDDEKILASLQKRFPGRIDHIIHRKNESIADGLEDFAKESDSDLIVLFTPKRNMIEKLFHKSVSRNLSLFSKTPILVFHY